MISIKGARSSSLGKVYIWKVSTDAIEQENREEAYKALVTARVWHEGHAHLGDDPEVGLGEYSTGEC